MVKPNQIWGTDITYVKANGIWFYLVAILDWYSRYVVNWKLSKNIYVNFCNETLNEALQMATPLIHNSDQVSQFTSNEYTNILNKKTSKSAWMDEADVLTTSLPKDYGEQLNRLKFILKIKGRKPILVIHIYYLDDGGKYRYI